MVDAVHDTVAARIRAAGLKATGPRVAILAALEADRRHPSADLIFESLRATHPTLSQSTVYSTLEIFLEAGLIRRMPSSGGKLRVDGTAQDHDHAVCRSCGEIFDIDTALTPRPAAPPELPHGLKLTNVFVEYEVLCAECAEDQTPNP